MKSKYKAELKRRVERTRAFHESDEPGDLLCTLNSWGRYEILEQHLCSYLEKLPLAEALDPASVDKMVAGYGAAMRESFERVFAVEDDVVPCAEVYWGIGGITAAQVGADPVVSGGTSWFEPGLSWDQIAQLEFDPEDKWIQLALHVNRALWREWDEDFFILPFLHRSPLDAANGLRGTDLFLELYTEPEKIKALTEWCADWSVSIEQFLRDNCDSPAPAGWGTGVWSTWLPDGAVFVNGDPVGLISREMQPEFEGPSTAKLFTGTGGGFFHNHAIGMHQIDLVCRTGGTLVHSIGPDPNQPVPVDVVLEDPAIAEQFVEASLHAPIALCNISPDQLDPILPILKRGRFILGIVYWEGWDPTELIGKVRAASNLK